MTATAAPPLLAITGLRAAYGKIAALKGVDLEVRAGEIVALIGANGAGKSTLMMTVFGRPRAREGRIAFDGQDITQLPTHLVARLRIAQAPEGRRIFARMTVRGKPADGRRRHRSQRGRARSRPGAGAGAVSAPQGTPRRSAAARCRAANSRCWRSAAR